MSRRIVWVAVLITGWAAWSTAGAQAQVRYIHTDALGSVVAVTNEQRVVIERREYEPYGHQLTPAVADGPGYTGHVQDAVTELTYMQQRYYDPQIGVFLSVDPVTAYDQPIHTFHRYRYANSNPYKFIDPDGRLSRCGVSCDDERADKRAEHGNAINRSFSDGASSTQSRNSEEDDYYAERAQIFARGKETFSEVGAFTAEVGKDAGQFLAFVRIGKWIGGIGRFLPGKSPASLPTNPSQLRHIFGNRPGHLADTPANRKLLIDVASSPVNRVGVDRFGNVWSSTTRADGTQVWVSTRNGIIQNGGLNQVPRTFPNIVGP